MTLFYSSNTIQLILAKDLGPRLTKINTPHEVNSARGTDFQVIIEIKNDISTSSAANLLEQFLPLFNCFYSPIKEKSFRGSNYRRILKRFYTMKKLPLICGHKGYSIQGEDNLIASHILAVQHGSPDQIYNLVFLCHDRTLKLERASFEDYRKYLRNQFKEHTRL